MSKHLVLSERPCCPHCHAFNEPPTNRYEDSRETRCAGCGGTFIVRFHARYSTEALAGPVTVASTGDFVCARITDLLMDRKHVDKIMDCAVPTKQKTVDLWAHAESLYPFLTRVRSTGTHNFQFLSDARVLRIYHAKECNCGAD